MKKEGIKVIIFDFDGVLVESVDIKTTAFAKLFEAEGQEIVKQVIDYHLKNAGVSRFEKFKHIYHNILNRELKKDTFDELCSKFSQLVVDQVVEAPYVKGAKEFLDNYSQVYDCFIASATPQDELEEIIRRRKMLHYFKAIFGAPLKKKDIVSKIMTFYPPNQNPKSFLYIGDALSDYEAAKKNGISFIAIINEKNMFLFTNISCTKIDSLKLLHNKLETLK